MSRILITGATGLIGTRLVALLLERGHQIACLVRGGKNDQKLPSAVTIYRWQPAQQQIDATAFEGVDAIIHLAGEGIADKRWSDARKQQLIASRVETLDLIRRTLATMPHQVQTLVSASAIGFYGADTGDAELTETSPAGHDFPARLVMQWEAAADQFASLNIRVVKLRTGIVLSTRGGALQKFMQPIRFAVGSPLGSGRQLQSWIHIDDLCALYLTAVEQAEWHGVYNAVAPEVVTNETLIKTTARLMHRPAILPNVPTFVLKTIFGEMASIVLGGNHVLNQRVKTETNFSYADPQLEPALRDLLTRKI